MRKYTCPDCGHKTDYQTNIGHQNDPKLFLPLLAEQNINISQDITSINDRISKLENSCSFNKTVSKPKKADELMKCIFCPKTIKGISKLQVHIKMNHNVKTDCLYCGNKSKSVGDLQTTESHLTKAPSVRKLSMKFQRRRLKGSLKRIWKVKSKQRATTIQLKEKKEKLADKPVEYFACTRCDYKTTEKDQLKAHYVEAHMKPKNVNKKDVKLQTSTINLQIPPPSFDPLWRFKHECEKCHIKFTSERELNLHIDRAHIVDNIQNTFNKTVDSQECGRRFRNIEYF